MERRKLGTTPFIVTPLAFGGNVFGWTADEATSFRLLDAFVAGGGNLIDTADSYSRWVSGHVGGESETIIGRWIARRGHHRDVVIATKVGSDMGEGHKILRQGYILRRVEDSLRRLQVEAIDLYQSHWDDESTPFAETLAAYDRLLRDGKVRAIGASNLTAPRLAQALAASDAAGLPRYNRTTTSSSAPSSKGRCRTCAYAKASGSFRTTRWRPASSPASTVPRRILARARAAAR